MCVLILRAISNISICHHRFVVDVTLVKSNDSYVPLGYKIEMSQHFIKIWAKWQKRFSLDLRKSGLKFYKTQKL